jgi:hypothetical protein
MTFKRVFLSAALLVAAPAALSQETRDPSPSSQGPATATANANAANPGMPATPTPLPKPHEDMIKLWKANLSEDFIKRQIETSNVIYALTAEDIIQCRNAGMPESLIQSMIQTTKRAPGDVQAAEARAAAAPAAAGAGAAAAPAAKPTPLLAEKANMRWEGMARRNGGVVILKSRWDTGALEFREETLRWTDAHDAGKNLLIPAKQIKEHFLSCQKKPGGNECFEWGFKIKDGEFRFRDVAWEQGEDKKVEEIFAFMKAIYPNVVASNVPVDSK